MADSPELVAHREWLGQIGQVGLVVSPNVLVKHGIGINRSRALEVQARLGELAESEKDDGEIRVNDAIAFFREVLEWRETIVAGSPGGPALRSGGAAARVRGQHPADVRRSRSIGRGLAGPDLGGRGGRPRQAAGG
jgi:hypothetical protein